ncbi:unnamed protein product [Schistocephalus solidus]|uniref:MATH domain-containing protein n=1 Tax=Schistocephalus solidus TaxID=70667 RepID=A0A183TBU1_SCHSO|nr:unnamed protein product [Schistocephalus solidus]
MDENSVEVVENDKNAEHLDWFFAYVFTWETELKFDNVNNAVVYAGPVLEYILFSKPVMGNELQNLKEAKSSSPDNKPAKFLIELAWSPWFKKNYLQLERVLARAKKMVNNCTNLSYEARLTELDLFTLTSKQIRSELIQTYLIVRGNDCALEFYVFFEFAGP